MGYEERRARERGEEAARYHDHSYETERSLRDAEYGSATDRDKAFAEGYHQEERRQERREEKREAEERAAERQSQRMSYDE